MTMYRNHAAKIWLVIGNRTACTFHIASLARQIKNAMRKSVHEGLQN